MSTEADKAEAFLSQIRSLIDGADARSKETRVADSKKAVKSIGVDSDVTFNARINKGLRDEFELLCKKNDTNMSREVKRYMRLAVAAQKLI